MRGKFRNLTGTTRHTQASLERVLISLSKNIRGRTVVDIPAGSGQSSKLLMELGAIVYPYDLFPEEFHSCKETICQIADLEAGLPIKSGFADYVLCQEGIEHIESQTKVFQEFNRILSPSGRLIVSTPNLSNLKHKISFLVSESERCDRLPPNELDSVSPGGGTRRFGHVFLIGVQRLRMFAAMAGFKIKKIHRCGVSTTSLIYFVLLWPLIFLVNFKVFLKIIFKHGNNSRRRIYSEIIKLNIHPRILIGRHLIVEFEKIN